MSIFLNLSIACSKYLKLSTCLLCPFALSNAKYPYLSVLILYSFASLPTIFEDIPRIFPISVAVYVFCSNLGNGKILIRSYITNYIYTYDGYQIYASSGDHDIINIDALNENILAN